MKKFLVFLMVLALTAGPVHALTYDQANYRKHLSACLSARGNDPIYNFIGEVDSEITGEMGTGTAFYVDSGVASAGAGTSWTAAVATLQEGIDLCTADAGDIVYVAQGHAENINAASALDADCAGITIIGFGENEHQPTLSMITDAAAEMTISAADVTMYNIRILGARSGGATAGLDITADGDGARILNCEFWETSNDMELLKMITVVADADFLVIADCRFISTPGGDDSEAIYFEGGSDKTVIKRNEFLGDWSGCVIDSTTATSTGIIVSDNHMWNADATAGKTFQTHASTSGNLTGNYFYGNGATFEVACDAMLMSPDNVNMQTENVEGRTYEAMLGAYTGPAAGTAVDDNVKAATDHLGSDTDAIIVDLTSAVTEPPTGKSLHDILHADGSYAYDNTTDSLESIGTDTDSLVAGQTTITNAIVALSDTGYVGTNTATSQTAPVVALLAGFGDDYFNTGWSMIIAHNIDADGSAPEGEVRDITDYSSALGEFTIETTTANLGNGDKVIVKRTEDLELDNPTMLGSAGTIRYVDSGTSGDGSGLTWENAYATLALAEAGSAADDVIYVAQGHDEEVTTGTLVLNLANLTVIGLGEGDARPLITCTDDGILMTLDNAGITVKNLRLQSGVTACDNAIRVEDAGIGCTIDNVAFIDGEASTTDEFEDVISVDQLASNLTVKNCTYYSLDATGHTNTFIDLEETTIDSPSIIGCTIFGMFAEAPIWGGAAAVPVNVLIKDNVISNTTTGQLCIEFGGAATGVCSGNMLYADTYGASGVTILLPGSMKCINNWAVDAVSEAAMPIPFSMETSDITAVADGSDLERLELLQELSDSKMAALGIDATTDEVYYVDSVSAVAGTGDTWATSVNTLKLGLDAATNSVGAYVFLGVKHAENVGGDTAIDCPGVTFVGLGVGEDRPKLTFDTQTDVLTHTVANVKYKNIIFICSAQDTTVGITLDGSSDGAIFEDCEFRNSTTNEFVDTITLASGCDNVRFTRCKFLNLTAAGGHISSINSTNGPCDHVIVEDCDFYGTFTTAAIESTQIELNWTVRNNTIYNYSTGDYAILFSAAALGTIYNNRCYGDTLGAVIDPGSMQCFNNTVTLAIDESGVVTPGVPQHDDKVHGTGQVFYVDASGSNGGGRTPATAFTTLDAGINATSANRGDFIYVMQGHTETFTGADGWDADVAGISIIGLGKGLNAPIFLFNHANAEVAVSGTGDNVWIENLRFHTTLDSVTIGVDLEDGADYVTFKDCIWHEQGDASGTDEFDEAVEVGACTATTFDGCTFKSEAAEAVSAISSSDITVGLTIKNCLIMGDYSGANINFDTAASTDIHILDNILINGDLVADNGLNAVAAIKVTDGSGGFVKGNHIACDVATALLMRVADDLTFMDNRVTDEDGDDNSDGDESAGAGVTTFADG